MSFREGVDWGYYIEKGFSGYLLSAELVRSNDACPEPYDRPPGVMMLVDCVLIFKSCFINTLGYEVWVESTFEIIEKVNTLQDLNILQLAVCYQNVTDSIYLKEEAERIKRADELAIQKKQSTR